MNVFVALPVAWALTLQGGPLKAQGAALVSALFDS